MEDLVDQLSSFKFTEFSLDFLGNMKKELPMYRVAIDSGFNWSAVDGTEKYDNDAKKSRAGRQAGNDAEVARRVWEWWKAKGSRFTYFKDAVRLVVLVQVSSASVERVFSHLKRILESSQHEILHDILEIRMFERINSKYYYLLE